MDDSSYNACTRCLSVNAGHSPNKLKETVRCILVVAGEGTVCALIAGIVH